MMDDADIRDMFAGLGDVKIKKMFGGKSVYFNGIITAIETDGEIFLKADALSAPQFEAAGARQWSYDGKGKVVKMPYWTVPDAALDDPEEIKNWTKLAYEAAMRVKK
jgi:DNA transformation protein and related proteins